MINSIEGKIIFRTFLEIKKQNSNFFFRFFRSIPKLIYSREFSDGLMVIPSEEDSLINHPDDVLGPLESYDEYGPYVPHQFVLRKEPQQQQYLDTLTACTHSLGNNNSINTIL